MVFIAYAMILPQQFSFNYTTRGSDVVLATYEDILHQAQQQDGAISFEKLLVGNDEQTQISYIVQPGDNLSEIAKSFGTTVAAISQINHITNTHAVSPWQRLTIAYEENVLYEVKDTTTLAEFSQKYDLAIDDLLTLNYFDSPNQQIDAGQQLFLPMTRRDAEKQGLIEKERFEMLDIPTNDEPIENTVEEETPDDTTIPTDEAEPTPWEPEGLEEIHQVVYTAEQVQQHLEDIKNGKQAEIPAQEPKQEVAVQKQKNNPVAEQPQKKAPETKSLEDFKQDTTSCGTNQCAFDNKCYKKPTHAVCATDNKQAWVCQEWYTDTWKGCINKDEQPKKKSSAKKSSSSVLNQWYFNPRKAGFPGYWRGAGHCTEYVAYYRWKNYGVNLRDFISGNAGSRYNSAQKSTLSTGKTPKVGAIAVMKYGASGYSGYGHVGIVTEINSASGQIKMQDANYVGRFIVSDHWVDMDDGIVGYIYP